METLNNTSFLMR